MALNSPLFVFGFLPVTLIIFFVAWRTGQNRLVLGGLLTASLLSYAWWNPKFLVLLIGSIVMNYCIGQTLHERTAQNADGRGWILGIGLAGNLSLLGYYKYANFLVNAAHDVFGTNHFLGAVAAPIGISFFTFTQLTYLVDAYGGQAAPYSFLEYCLFAAFFPYIGSGPIVNHREIIPQWNSGMWRSTPEDLSIGLTLFGLGLFKKSVLADGIAACASPVFSAAAHGTTLTFFEAWWGAIAYALQLYFDFSGYSDMAIGSARLFGIKLPINFNSPYKALNIIDFWNRWHMTLTRFLTNYIYNPLILSITRRRIEQGQPTLRKSGNSPGTFIAMVALPILITMFASGVWHGAGWTFIAFGLLHGIYLTINHGWHMLRHSWGITRSFSWVGGTIARGITFAGVVISFVFFRSENFRSAVQLIMAMIGFHGVSLPRSLHGRWPGWELRLAAHGITFQGMTLTPLQETLSWIFGLLMVVWAFPNSQQWLSAFKPALDIGKSQEKHKSKPWVSWSPSWGWAAACGAMTVIAFWTIVGVARPTEFIYFKF